jgi:hypothetical protein
MAFDIDDGYTLDGITLPQHRKETGLPVIQFKYRPALAEELNRWRYKINHAVNADEMFAATTKLLCDHLVSWDVAAKKQPAPITHDSLKKLPESTLEQILDAVTTWAPAEQAKTEGNSPGA